MTWKKEPNSSVHSSIENENLEKARACLQALVDDERLPPKSRKALAKEYQELTKQLEKIQRGDIHIAVFGRVSVGKSALLNALLGKDVFKTSVLHGETKTAAQDLWHEFEGGGIYLIDTPGIDEIDGNERTKIAQKVAKRADVILFVVDSDLTALEFKALESFHLGKNKPLDSVIIVLNKVDRLSDDNRFKLLAHIKAQTQNLFTVVATSANPSKYKEIIASPHGDFERVVKPAPEISALKDELWQKLISNGKSYAALNAVVFAQDISEEIAKKIIATRNDLATSTIKRHAIPKALGVALNPAPAVDLLALSADCSMVYSLSKIYEIDFTLKESQSFIWSVSKSSALMVGTIFVPHLASSILKAFSGGVSTVFMGALQGGAAFYGSIVIGEAAKKYFANGASWGKLGAKKVLAEIIASLDKDAIFTEFSEILKKNSTAPKKGSS